MRALGYSRRKPPLETQTKKEVTEKSTETLPVSADSQPSEEFDESVELLQLFEILFLISDSTNLSVELRILIPAQPQINEAAIASFFVSLNLSAIAGLIKVARNNPTIVVLIK